MNKDKEINKLKVKEEIVLIVDLSVPASVLFIKIHNSKIIFRKEWWSFLDLNLQTIFRMWDKDQSIEPSKVGNWFTWWWRQVTTSSNVPISRYRTVCNAADQSFSVRFHKIKSGLHCLSILSPFFRSWLRSHRNAQRYHNLKLTILEIVHQKDDTTAIFR